VCKDLGSRFIAFVLCACIKVSLPNVEPDPGKSVREPAARACHTGNCCERDQPAGAFGKNVETCFVTQDFWVKGVN
jgi:hypothetical protein